MSIISDTRKEVIIMSNANNNEFQNKKLLNSKDIFLIYLSALLPCSLETLRETLDKKNISKVLKLTEEGLLSLSESGILEFTEQGKLTVFKIIYKEEIKIFVENLMLNGYEIKPETINNFLLSFSLPIELCSAADYNANKILNLDNYINYITNREDLNINTK